MTNIDEPTVVNVGWIHNFEIKEMSNGLFRIYNHGTYIESLPSVSECRMFINDLIN